MKRSVNLKGIRWNGTSEQMKNAIATLRWLGLDDEEIRDELLKWQARQDAAKQPEAMKEVQP
jgi:hypothetical protein